MDAPTTFLAALPMSAAALAVCVFLMAWPGRVTPKGRALLGLVASAGVWGFFYALELASPSLATKVFMAQCQYLGIVFVAPSWCIAAIRTSGHTKWLTPARLALLFVIPAATLIAAFTNQYFGLLWRDIRIGQGPIPILEFTYGPMFWVNNQFAWLTLGGGTLLLLRTTWRQYRLHSAHAALMFLTILAPWLANVMYILRTGPLPGLDLTPCAFIISAMVMTYGIARFDLTHILPIARENILENLGAAVFVIDNRGLFVDANRAGRDLLGDPSRALVGEPVDTALGGFPVLLALAKTPDGTSETFPVTDDGGRALEARVTTLYGVDGGSVGRAIVCHDISQRLDAEERLRQSEARYRGYFELGLVGMAITSPEKGWVTFNDHLCEMLGYGREELSRLTWAELTHPDDLAPDVAQFQRVVRGEIDAYAMEKRFIRKDGRVIVTDLSVRCVRRPDGSLDHFLAMLHDITQHKVSEEALRDSENKARSILNASTAGIAMFDVEARVLDCNSVFAEGFHRTLPEVIGHSIWEFSAPDARARREAAFNTVVASGEPLHAVDEREGIWNDYTLFPVKDRNGNTTAVVLYVVEITERVRLEHEKEALTAQYQQAQRMEAVGQLAGGIAHDFNNLLQVIHGYTDIARNSLGEPAGVEAALDRIETASERAASLVRQLLVFSRRQVVQLKVVDLNDVLGETLEMVERLIGANIRIDYSPSPDALTVLADAAMIGQVIINLCVNARDAMPSGGTVTIRADVAPAETGPPNGEDGNVTPYAVILVRDTGTGMDEQTLEHIFEPFFTTKDVGRGTGLGLATAYGIVKQHLGRISATSVPGVGSEFQVYLPLSLPPDAVTVPQGRSAMQGGTETILIAEDNDLVRDLAKNLLEHAGYRVVIAGDGEEAVRLFAEQPDSFDLALLDLVMPNLCGREASDAIRQLRPGFPILFASGYHHESAQTDFALNDEFTLIPKPYRADTLLNAVRDALGKTANRA